MRIEFGEVRVNPGVMAHLEDCLKSNWVSGGRKTKVLEASWGKLFGYPYNVAVSNGTDADTACCMTLYDFGAKRGDEIIAPALAFAAVGNSILTAGFKPVFVDVKRETLDIDADQIEDKITRRTRAIMPVHTMGKPCDMDKIMGIAEKHGLKVIEDCCEAHGGKYHDRFVGSIGDMASFSFYVAHIICCGDGGMVSTKSREVADLLDSVKHHGRRPGDLYFDHIRYGLNFRMNDLTASMGIPELEDFWKIFNKRKENLVYLTEQNRDLGDVVHFIEEEPGEVISPHAFSITLRDPQHNYHRLFNFLESKGIQCKRNFGSMPTQHKAFSHLGYRFGEFPEAEYVGENGLHFGCHQHLSRADLDYATEVLHEYFGRK